MAPAKKKAVQVKRLRDKKRAVRAPTGPGKLLSPQTVRVIESDYQVMIMRRDGHTIQQIAETLGLNQSTVSEKIKKVLSNTIGEMAETTEEHRQLELERYDAIIKTYMPMCIAGNLAAAAVILQVSQQRRKLLSLDIPEVKRLEVTAIREYVGVDLEQV